MDFNRECQPESYSGQVVSNSFTLVHPQKNRVHRVHAGLGISMPAVGVINSTVATGLQPLPEAAHRGRLIHPRGFAAQ